MNDDKTSEKVDAHKAHSVREINSSDLFQADRMIVINHECEQYRLTVTRNNKLILQK